MQTLDEFNEERRRGYEEIEELKKPHPNGIKCPECPDELWDSNPMLTLTSNPPQKNVHCPNCGYRGFRLA